MTLETVLKNLNQIHYHPYAFIICTYVSFISFYVYIYFLNARNLVRTIVFFFPFVFFLSSAHFLVHYYSTIPKQMEHWYKNTFLSYVKSKPSDTYPVTDYHITSFDPDTKHYEIYVTYKDKKKIKKFSGWADIQSSKEPKDSFSFKTVDKSVPFELSNKQYTITLTTQEAPNKHLPIGKEKQYPFGISDYLDSEFGGIILFLFYFGHVVFAGTCLLCAFGLLEFVANFFLSEETENAEILVPLSVEKEPAEDLEKKKHIRKIRI